MTEKQFIKLTKSVPVFNASQNNGSLPATGLEADFR
jgi:hypothetical protein